MKLSQHQINQLLEVAHQPLDLSGPQVRIQKGVSGFPTSTELLKIVDSLRAQALYDGKTGLIRHEHAEDIFNQKLNVLNLEQLEKEKQSLVFIRIDIDKFKDINEHYGHLVGDDVIAIFSRVLLAELRGSQFAVRAGGDEFIVVLPVVPLFCLDRIICRIYESFKKMLQQEMQDTVVEGVQFSSGVVFWPFSTNIPENFFKILNKQADALQLVAKNYPGRYIVSPFKDTEIDNET